MKSITIAEKAYKLTEPDNLASIIENSTGLSLKELRGFLQAHASPGLVAAALRPFLPEGAPSTSEIASDMSGDAFEAIRGKVAALYQEVVRG